MTTWTHAQRIVKYFMCIQMKMVIKNRFSWQILPAEKRRPTLLAIFCVVILRAADILATVAVHTCEAKQFVTRRYVQSLEM